MVYPTINVAATGSNIKRLRKEHGFSVREIQDFLGFEAPQAIYKWEKGLNLPTTDNLYALACFYGVKIDDILVSDRDVVVLNEKVRYNESERLKICA